MSNGVPLPGIEHVVVLMLENRSFDNVLGGLYPGLPQQGKYRGLCGTESNPLDPAPVTVFQGPADQSTWTMPYPDPGELYQDMVMQIFAATNSDGPANMLGFAGNYSMQPPSYDKIPPVAQNIMQYYSDQTMPISSALAQLYAVCDCWFASGPVQTIANRIFTHCGTPGIVPGTNRSRVNNPDFSPHWPHPFSPTVADTTIFALLDQLLPDGVAPGCTDQPPTPTALNWKVYYHDSPLSVLCDYVYSKWCLDSFYGGNVETFEASEFAKGFAYDVANGYLPKYSYIEPCYTDEFYGVPNSNHPGGAGIDWDNPNGQSLPPAIDVRNGENLLLRLCTVLLENPAVFDKTLLIVTYDEHGGLYDHVPPPSAVSPFQEPVDNFNYDRYGVRVPAILVNPRIKPGTIYPARNAGDPIPDPPFDHTSIISTLIAQFTQFPLSASVAPRVASAPKLRGLIPAGQAADERPPPPRPMTLPVGEQPRTPRGEPRPKPDAPNLAGALGPIYQRIKQSKRYPSVMATGRTVR